MRCFSYIVARDYGFAPNPFHGFCTLATCKPRIREAAQVGDWVFGLSPIADGNKLIYAMKVTEKITFNEYWNNKNYECKKPALNGSLITMYGDNIYHQNKAGEWIQADSHHSYENGETNLLNLEKDTSINFVLLSDDFYYFGSNSIDIPLGLKEKFAIRRYHRNVDEKDGQLVIDFLRKNYEVGIIGFPTKFSKFERFHGKD